MVKMDLPRDVARVMDALGAGGYEAYLVGGCVRDALRGERPSDYDVATDALPMETAAALRNFRLLRHGEKHGTIAAVTEARVVEVTTYRVDGAYSDGRRPDSVTFTRDLSSDLLRRDFTVNALAYNRARGLIDEVGGLLDLRARLVRCVGDARTRYDEDALRILRALRFSACLDFDIEPDTRAAAILAREKLRGISRERIQAEMTKLVLGARAGRVLLFARAVIDVCVPGYG
jgi:tRNA nucleotidyltransferase (CCA-adding enzyme)